MSSLVSSSTSKCGEATATICINDYLHDYCLLDVFDHLPLAELTRIDQVCARWKALRWSSLCRHKKLTLIVKNDSCHDMQHLRFTIPYSNELRNVIPGWKTLKITNEAKDDSPKTGDKETSIDWSQLKLPKINFETTKWLFMNFRNINSLTILVSELQPFSTQSIKWLLDKWSSNLVSLKLYLGDIYWANMSRIYESINAMEVLRQLTLVASSFLQLKPSTSMQILSQLDELYIFSYDPTSLILDLLKNNASNNCRLKRIGMNNSRYDWTEPIGSLLSLDTNLAAQFVYLGWNLTMSSYQLHLFCNQFSSLESIQLTIKVGQSYARLLNCLAPLKRLVYLQLTLKDNYKLPLFVHNEDDDDKSAKLAQLHSVKAFTLDASIESHKEIVKMELHWTIPNVQVIQISKHQIGCSICKYTDEETDDSLKYFLNNEKLVFECAHLLAQNLTTCDLIHTVYVDRLGFIVTCSHRRFY